MGLKRTYEPISPIPSIKVKYINCNMVTIVRPVDRNDINQYIRYMALRGR